MLSFTVNNLGDVAIFECAGRITIEGGDALRSAVLRQPYVQVVVLDLKGVTKIDAAGLGVLASLRSWAKATGTELKLMNVAPRLERLLELTGLKSVLNICSAREMLDLWCRALHQTAAMARTPMKAAAGF
jgi:anti-anti-sigma factor